MEGRSAEGDFAASAKGLIVRDGSSLFFVPGSVAERVVHHPRVSAVPGSDVGMALVFGRIVPVIELGTTGHRRHALLCRSGGLRVALTGFEVLACGYYPEEGANVRFGGELVQTLDLDSRLKPWLERAAALAQRSMLT
jgi:hypothetical protein